MYVAIFVTIFKRGKLILRVTFDAAIRYGRLAYPDELGSLNFPGKVETIATLFSTKPYEMYRIITDPGNNGIRIAAICNQRDHRTRYSGRAALLAGGRRRPCCRCAR